MHRNKQNAGRIARPGSPFHFFLLDRRENLTRQGVRVDSKKEFEAEAFSAWLELSVKEPDKMKKYMDKHNEWETKKNSFKHRNKFDQSGRSLEKIKEQDKMKTEEKIEQKQFVETAVKNLDIKGHLTKNNFFIVHFNTITPSTGTLEGKHYPCEIGLVRFSIQEGLDKSLHEFISPLQIPFGYSFEAIKKSKETHNIPPDPLEFSRYEDDYNAIFASIKKFMSNNEFEEAILVVYVMPNHEDAAKSVFKFICEKAGQSEKTFKVCLLPQLLFELMKVAPGGKIADGDKVPDSILTANKHLDNDSFKYWPQLGCYFHEKLGINTHHCALTIARCHAFNISQICSKAYNVLIHPGRHSPPENLGSSSTASRVSTEIVKQAVTQETKNNWGTKISPHAAPAGISPIPPGFDPNQVTVGPGAKLFPGLHPELDESSSQVEDFSQRSIGHRDSFMFSFRPSSSVESVVKAGEANQVSQNVSLLKLPSSNNQTRHEVAKGSSAFHSKKALDGIRPITEGEMVKENRKVKNALNGVRPIPEGKKVMKEGIQPCQVGGQKLAKGKEKANMKFEIKTIKQEKDINTDMKNEISDNVDSLELKDLKDNCSQNTEMDNKTKHRERPKTSNGVQLESSRARLSTDENVSSLMVEKNCAETGGRDAMNFVFESGSRSLNNAEYSVVGKNAFEVRKDVKSAVKSHSILNVPDALNSTVEKREKVVEKIGGVGRHRGRGSVLTCLDNTVNLTVGKNALKISGKENSSKVGNLSVCLDDDFNTTVGECDKTFQKIRRQRGRGNVLTCLGNSANSTVGKSALENLSVSNGFDDGDTTTVWKHEKIVQKISGVGRGRGNVKVIRKGSATKRM